MKRTALPAALAAAAIALTAAACGHTPAGGAGAAASASQHVSSALANHPTVSSDLTAAEQQLLANLQANFDPKHPKKSVETAVQKTYPKGSTAKIANYAVRTFTLTVLTTKGPGSARDSWLQGVDTYARAQGANPAVSQSPSAVTT
jgi:hypothetical protein